MSDMWAERRWSESRVARLGSFFKTVSTWSSSKYQNLALSAKFWYLEGLQLESLISWCSKNFNWWSLSKFSWPWKGQIWQLCVTLAVVTRHGVHDSFFLWFLFIIANSRRKINKNLQENGMLAPQLCLVPADYRSFSRECTKMHCQKSARKSELRTPSRAATDTEPGLPHLAFSWPRYFAWNLSVEVLRASTEDWLELKFFPNIEKWR